MSSTFSLTITISKNGGHKTAGKGARTCTRAAYNDASFFPRRQQPPAMQPLNSIVIIFCSANLNFAENVHYACIIVCSALNCKQYSLSNEFCVHFVSWMNVNKRHNVLLGIWKDFAISFASFLVSYVIQFNKPI